ncbi:hypothetical protein pdam_00011255, partial [Pocillopora damicornis]
MPPETFSYLKSLRNLRMDSFSLCCYASLHLEKVSCEYPKLEGNALSSCNRMIDASGPRRSIWLLVSKSQRRVKAHGEAEVSSNSIKRESALARRVFVIILTDFSCWIPVIILSILALTGKFHDEQGVAYVWFAVFVLPVNSSVNPVLYTFSTPK